MAALENAVERDLPVATSSASKCLIQVYGTGDLTTTAATFTKVLNRTYGTAPLVVSCHVVDPTGTSLCNANARIDGTSVSIIASAAASVSDAQFRVTLEVDNSTL